MKRTPQRQWRLKWWLAVHVVVLLGFLWVLSFFAAVGLGFGRIQPTTPPGGVYVLGSSKRSNFEASLARGGLLFVVNGTRTDVVYYDDNMGCSSTDFGILYTVTMDRVAAPVVLWPSSVQPRPWAGRYVLIPIWMPLLVSIAVLLWIWCCRRPKAGSCPSCGYSLHGIRASAACPECGLGPQLATKVR